MNFALNVIAKGSIILMGTGFLCVLLQRASASTRHAVWVLAIVACNPRQVNGLHVPSFIAGSGGLLRYLRKG